ncbi:type VI secretion system baseplate subunit TssG [Salmonella enterica]|nr:type VI secretion system baseplate subunit TssG [Salmonella enterica]EBS3177291.1 type VI secretion system baseplate subunit TssG [Salmonella enterica subsp. enterica serovar Newport]EBS3869528.1 type VI secretion system baseplate subunit TssG [Salmonella enterica subsp. enterica serovar Kimberley]ECL1759190.1 type VI secretion system baseplate subunit TssG [Salmonella enterica]EDL3630196.1 type VI secretion system baseplate subunit TssG [Salmonella enterica subsp. enterica serovar Newport]
MVRDRRNGLDSVKERLQREPWLFSLEQCVRLAEMNGEFPELCGDTGLAFAPAEISVQHDGRLRVYSLGPGGADGMLPYGWLEWLQQVAQDKNAAAQDFLNLFHRRLIEHHCRSLSLWRLAIPYTPREQAPSLAIMRALSGHATEALQKYGSHRLLTQCGLLANRRRSVEGFIALAAAMLNVLLCVETYIGRWQTLPLAQQGRISCRLGGDTMIGRCAWNQHAVLRVHFQADTVAQWRAFLPGSEGLQTLSWLGAVWFGAGVSLELVMRGILELDSILTCKSPPFLGRTAQLRGRSSFCCRQYLKENATWF